MVGFILTGHGQFAPGLASAIAMVAGDQPAFTVVPFEGDQAASYGEDLRAAITAMREECDGVLVFTDLLGGTPFNQAMMIAQDVDNVEVLTGTNLPMVIELLFLRGNATLAELGEQAVTVGQTGITAQTAASDVYKRQAAHRAQAGSRGSFRRRYLRNRQRHRRREGPDQSPIRSRRRCFALRDSGDQVTVVSKYRKEADQHGRTQHSSYPHR